MKILYTIALSILFSFTIFAAQGFAQSATTTATGTVLAPLTVSATGLDFGIEIFPGINEVVDKSDAGSAQFDVSGEAGKEITATFILPDELSGDTDPLSISFSATDGGHATATTTRGGEGVFDPSGTLTTTLETTSGELFIWLGGTVEPTETQPAGTYTADITLDTAYTGN